MNYLGLLWCAATIVGVALFYKRPILVVLVMLLGGLPYVAFGDSGLYSNLPTRLIALIVVTALIAIGCIAVDAKIRAKKCEALLAAGAFSSDGEDKAR